VRLAFPWLLVFLSACAPAPPLLTFWPGSPGLAPGPEALRRAILDGLDRLQALESWYDWEASKAHTKLRVMAVFSVAAAASAGAAAGVLMQPTLPDLARPGLGAAAIASAATSGAFTLIPAAHGYAWKERGYRAQAALVRAEILALSVPCSPSVWNDPATPIEQVEACAQAVDAAWERGLHFDDGSACIPPESGAFARHLQRGLRPSP
jgi:hypothetical protein